jgi:hypothetical protein
MSMVSQDEVLLRFQHVMDKTEDEEPVVFSLQVSGFVTFYSVRSIWGPIEVAARDGQDGGRGTSRL